MRLWHKDLEAFILEESKTVIANTEMRHYEWKDKDTNETICKVQVFDWWDGVNMHGLEVSEKHRGKGLSYAVVDYAVKVLKARNLAVEKENSIALHVYDECGFEIADEDENYYYMTYEKKV